MFSVVLEGIKKEAGRGFSEYAEAHARVPELAPYTTAVDLVAAMTAPSFVSSPHAAPLVAALVVEAQRSRSRLWTSLLVTAFSRMLMRLRVRLGQPKDDERDQTVLLAFLDAVRTIRPSAHAARGLRLSTFRAVFDAARIRRAEPIGEELDEERHALETFRADESAEASEIVRIIAAEGGDELLDVLLATRAGDETLLAYVTRTCADPGARAAEYERLKRARQNLEQNLRARTLRKGVCAA